MSNNKHKTNNKEVDGFNKTTVKNLLIMAIPIVLVSLVLMGGSCATESTAAQISRCREEGIMAQEAFSLIGVAFWRKKNLIQILLIDLFEQGLFTIKYTVDKKCFKLETVAKTGCFTRIKASGLNRQYWS